MPFFFFNDTATTEIYPLSLHDALPIFYAFIMQSFVECGLSGAIVLYLLRLDLEGMHTANAPRRRCDEDRKSTRLNSSHSQISYAVFCLKKKTPAMQPDLVRRATPTRPR